MFNIPLESDWASLQRKRLETNIPTTHVLDSLREKLRSSSPENKNSLYFRKSSKSPQGRFELVPQNQRDISSLTSLAPQASMVRENDSTRDKPIQENLENSFNGEIRDIFARTREERNALLDQSLKISRLDKDYSKFFSKTKPISEKESMKSYSQIENTNDLKNMPINKREDDKIPSRTSIASLISEKNIGKQPENQTTNSKKEVPSQIEGKTNKTSSKNLDGARDLLQTEARKDSKDPNPEKPSSQNKIQEESSSNKTEEISDIPRKTTSQAQVEEVAERKKSEVEQQKATNEVNEQKSPKTQEAVAKSNESTRKGLSQNDEKIQTLNQEKKEETKDFVESKIETTEKKEKDTKHKPNHTEESESLQRSSSIIIEKESETREKTKNKAPSQKESLKAETLKESQDSKMVEKKNKVHSSENKSSKLKVNLMDEVEDIIETYSIARSVKNNEEFAIYKDLGPQLREQLKPNNGQKELYHTDFIDDEIDFDPANITFENMLEIISGKITKERLMKELESLQSVSVQIKKSSPKKKSPSKSKKEKEESPKKSSKEKGKPKSKEEKKGSSKRNAHVQDDKYLLNETITQETQTFQDSVDQETQTAKGVIFISNNTEDTTEVGTIIKNIETFKKAKKDTERLTSEEAAKNLREEFNKRLEKYLTDLLYILADDVRKEKKLQDNITYLVTNANRLERKTYGPYRKNDVLIYALKEYKVVKDEKLRERILEQEMLKPKNSYYIPNEDEEEDIEGHSYLAYNVNSGNMESQSMFSSKHDRSFERSHRNIPTTSSQTERSRKYSPNTSQYSSRDAYKSYTSNSGGKALNKSITSSNKTPQKSARTPKKVADDDDDDGWIGAESLTKAFAKEDKWERMPKKP